MDFKHMLRIIQGDLLAVLAASWMKTLPLKLVCAHFIPHPRAGDVFVCLGTIIPLARKQHRDRDFTRSFFDITR